jgi:hypothetical protein
MKREQANKEEIRQAAELIAEMEHESSDMLLEAIEFNGNKIESIKFNGVEFNIYGQLAIIDENKFSIRITKIYHFDSTEDIAAASDNYGSIDVKETIH